MSWNILTWREQKAIVPPGRWCKCHAGNFVERREVKLTGPFRIGYPPPSTYKCSSPFGHLRIIVNNEPKREERRRVVTFGDSQEYRVLGVVCQNHIDPIVHFRSSGRTALYNPPTLLLILTPSVYFHHEPKEEWTWHQILILFHSFDALWWNFFLPFFKVRHALVSSNDLAVVC